jgi:cobalt-zinc-cadmium efflux system outer membrane protein
VALLEKRALPRALDNEALAREAHRAGKIDLAAFLLIRRDALDVRREHLDRLLDAALAGIDLWVAVGAPTSKDGTP